MRTGPWFGRSSALLALAPILALGGAVAALAASLPPAAKSSHANVSAVVRVDSQGDPIAGRKLFLANNCYICHGGRGGGGMCPSLRDNKPDEGDVLKALQNGTPVGMPSFAALLARPDMEDLFAYIDSLRTPAEPTFTHWWEANPTQ